MRDARGPQAFGYAEAYRDGMQAIGAVEVDILACVNEIKASHPGCYGDEQEPGWRSDGACYSKPPTQRGASIGNAEHQMAEPCEPFGVVVRGEDDHGHGQQLYRQLIELPGSED